MNILGTEISSEWVVKWSVYVFVASQSTAIIQAIFTIPLWYSLIIELVIIYIIFKTNIHGKFARWYISL